MDGAQKSVFDPKQFGTVFFRHAAAAMRGGRVAPYADKITCLWQAEADLIAGQTKDAPQARLGQKPPVVNKKPRAMAPGF